MGSLYPSALSLFVRLNARITDLVFEPVSLLWLLTGGLFLLGYLYDYWTLNEQIDDVNANLGKG